VSSQVQDRQTAASRSFVALRRRPRVSHRSGTLDEFSRPGSPIRHAERPVPHVLTRGSMASIGTPRRSSGWARESLTSPRPDQTWVFRWGPPVRRSGSYDDGGFGVVADDAESAGEVVPEPSRTEP
jgi:hypothetical protein